MPSAVVPTPASAAARTARSAVTPNSNSVNIVVGKNAKFLVGGEMGSFFQSKVAAAGGDAAQVQLVRFGGEREVGGVKVASVPAVHSNGISPAFLEGELAEALETNGLTAYLGPPGGYVLQFSNGLVVYLSGDTGITAEQDVVVRRHFGANLAVMNIGGIFSTGPPEAAWVIDELVQPAAVIVSHANEAATQNGEVQPVPRPRPSSRRSRCRSTCRSAAAPWSSTARPPASPAADVIVVSPARARAPDRAV